LNHIGRAVGLVSVSHALYAVGVVWRVYSCLLLLASAAQYHCGW